jgi:hypothetical protein
MNSGKLTLAAASQPKRTVIVPMDHPMYDGPVPAWKTHSS